MESIFLNILDMSLTAGCIIGVVLILRLFLKRLSKKYSYFLWSVVGFRLLCPVSFNSIFSIFNLKLFDRVNISGEDNDIAGKLSRVRNVFGTVSQKAGSGMNVAGMNGTGSVGTEITGTGLMTSGSMVFDPAVSGTVTAVDAVDKLGNVTASVSAGMPADSMADITGNFGSMAAGGEYWVKVLMIIWLVGMTIMLVYGIVSYIIMAGKLRNAVWKENNVYSSDMIDAPFVFGLVHPRIYLPDFLETGALEYVLSHENYHIRRLDYIVKPVAFVLLCIHWFNPLVWAAFYIMGRDMEMSCDEAVLAWMVTEQKCVKNGKTELEVVKGYSYALLSCASQGSFNTLFQLGFGEMPVKGRIKNVLRYKKYSPVVTAVLLIFCIFVLVACSTNSKKDGNYPENTTTPEYILEVRDEFSFTQGRELDSSVKDSTDIDVTGISNGENLESIRGEAPVYPMPVDNASLTAKYGYIKTVDGMSFNNYDNFAVDKGSNVYAVATGTVLKTGMEDDRGLGVVIQNDDGYTTEYYHLDSVIVNPDDIVVEGTVIGLAGESGNATGPMLSFGVSWDDTDTQIEWVEPVYTENRYIRLDVDYVLNDDGTYSCNGNTYKYELQVRGTEGESLITYIILTNDEETSFEDVSYSLKSSQIDTKAPRFVILGWY